MQSAPSPITDRKVRFALAGCGRIAANHLGAIERHADRAELAAVCDTDAAAVQAAADRTGARAFGSYRAMLAECDADCVILTTPSGLHPQRRSRRPRPAAT
jgi:UDP-N-acetyl-2-amino-2-deoxyglucuronate dehydrogenase